MSQQPRENAGDGDAVAGPEVTDARMADPCGAPRETPSQDRALPGDSPLRSPYTALAVCGLLLLAVAMVFGQTVAYDFVNLDDNLYVYENQHVKNGLSLDGIAWAFASTDADNWHPLTWLSHMLDCQLYGLHAGGHHFTNVLLHAATVVLLFLVLWRMTNDLWPSAFVAVLFAIHPLRAESVAWVSERKDVLSGLLFMLTLGAYLRYVRRPFSLVHYVGMAALFALGLMCKPMLVTLPFVLLLLDYWPLGRFAGQLSPVAPEWCGGTWLAANAAAGRPPQPSVLPMLEGRFSVAHRLLIEKLPLFALSAASCVATAVAQRHAVQSIDRFSPVARAANALVSYATYLGQFSCPAGLAAYYPHQKGDLPLWQVVAAALLLAIITAGAAAYRRRYPWFCVGWFWYVGMLVPVIGLVQVGTQAMADRYTYLPQIGLAIALTWGAIHAIESWPNRIQVCGVVSALVVVLMLGCTWQQVSYWRNSGTLWTHALACTSGNAIAHDNLGVFLREQGRRDEAICHFQEALEIKPDCVNFQSNFGACLCELGYVDEAAAHIRKAVEADPGNADLRYVSASILAKQGRLDAAAAEYRKSLEIKPDHADSHNNLGLLLVHAGEIDEAIQHYRMAIAAKPQNARAHYNLGNALARQNQFDAAIAEYEIALAIKPDDLLAVLVHEDLGAALASRGRTGEAIAHCREALKIKPDYAEGQYNLGLLMAGSGQANEAMTHFQTALALASQQKNTALADALRARISAAQGGSSPHNSAEPPPGHSAGL